MYLTAYEDVVSALETVDQLNYSDFFMVVKNAYPIEKLFIQRLNRMVNGKEIAFLSVRDIVIAKDSQQSGVFTNLLSTLEKQNIPIMVNDIVNDKLDDFLMKRGYIAYSHQKNDSKTRSRYVLGLLK